MDGSDGELVPAPVRDGGAAQQAGQGADHWSLLAASFRRSDQQAAVVELYTTIAGWEETTTQDKFWDTILSTREHDGAGSRAYVCQVLKCLVDRCDRDRLEVSEGCLHNLLRLRSTVGGGGASAQELAEQETMRALGEEGAHPVKRALYAPCAPRRGGCLRVHAPPCKTRYVYTSCV
jgi:hypothetical protein